MCYYSNSTIPSLYFSYYCSGICKKKNQSICLTHQLFLSTLKKLSRTDERVCFIKQIVWDQFPYCIITCPSLSKTTETLSMSYVDICTNCWQVFKCAQTLLLLLNPAVNGRIFLLSEMEKSFFWVPHLFDTCFPLRCWNIEATNCRKCPFDSRICSYALS